MLRDFNKQAAGWDENPGRVKLANVIADAIIDRLDPSPGMDVLEFGCGTGLISLRLQPFVNSVTGVDSSERMLDVFQSKIDAAGIENAQAVYLDPGLEPAIHGSYHVIVISMTLHHVPEISPLLSMFAKNLLLGGRLFIADLDGDGGLFHDDNTGVFHNGFERDRLMEEMSMAGFSNIKVQTATTVEKPGAGGVARTFSIFLMSGDRN
jgi:2-polyprenyl-3-methyl-5-hydroxy-6-metoxy-1,4-benzoquinol methylase